MILTKMFLLERWKKETFGTVSNVLSSAIDHASISKKLYKICLPI